jgi:hypothetical protein
LLEVGAVGKEPVYVPRCANYKGASSGIAGPYISLIEARNVDADHAVCEKSAMRFAATD